MATLMSALIAQVRGHLNEPVPSFWTDLEILGHLTNGAKDLWKAINDTYQDFFLTIDDTHVTQDPGLLVLTGVPADVSRVEAIEPVNPESHPVIYTPKRYAHPDFAAARAQGAVDVGGAVIFFHVSQAGAPVGAPTIHVAPKLSTQVPVRLVYVPVLGALTTASTNPIPGESDNALVAWGVSNARAKEREDRSPDPEWLSVYGTEKQGILTSLTPRQTQEPDVVEGMFEDYW